MQFDISPNQFIFKNVIAKFNGKCVSCESPIYKNENIKWNKRIGAFCMFCNPNEWIEKNPEKLEELL
jgi:hypothetical protein